MCWIDIEWLTEEIGILRAFRPGVRFEDRYFFSATIQKIPKGLKIMGVSSSFTLKEGRQMISLLAQLGFKNLFWDRWKKDTILSKSFSIEKKYARKEETTMNDKVDVSFTFSVKGQEELSVSIDLKQTSVLVAAAWENVILKGLAGLNDEQIASAKASTASK